MKARKKIIQFKNATSIEYVVRRISAFIARKLMKTNITPNQITLFRLPMILFVIYQFSIGHYKNLLVASFFLVLHAILDRVDGDLAVLKNLKTAKGAFFEQALDKVFGKLSGLLGFAIAFGVYRQTDSLLVWITLLFLLFGSYLFEFFMSIKKEEGMSSFEWKKSIKKSHKFRIGHFLYNLSYWQQLIIAFFAVLYLPVNILFGLNSMLLLLLSYAVLFNCMLIGMIYLQYQNIKG